MPVKKLNRLEGKKKEESFHTFTDFFIQHQQLEMQIIRQISDFSHLLSSIHDSSHALSFLTLHRFTACFLNTTVKYLWMSTISNFCVWEISSNSTSKQQKQIMQSLLSCFWIPSPKTAAECMTKAAEIHLDVTREWGQEKIATWLPQIWSTRCLSASADPSFSFFYHFNGR